MRKNQIRSEVDCLKRFVLCLALCLHLAQKICCMAYHACMQRNAFTTQGQFRHWYFISAHVLYEHSLDMIRCSDGPSALK